MLGAALGKVREKEIECGDAATLCGIPRDREMKKSFLIVFKFHYMLGMKNVSLVFFKWFHHQRFK